MHQRPREGGAISLSPVAVAATGDSEGGEDGCVIGLEIFLLQQSRDFQVTPDHYINVNHL